MKPNNAGEDMWLRAETANEKLKQDSQTPKADVMQTISVSYITQIEVLSAKKKSSDVISFIS